MLSHVYNLTFPTNQRMPGILLLSGASVLAAEPLFWLVGTWYRDGYDGMGWLAGAFTLLVYFYSWRSPLQHGAHSTTLPFGLLAATASLRLLSQLLDINVVGALLLCVDVFALGKFSLLKWRERAVSPFWLAVVFAFSLPIEPIVQRLLGYDLQLLSSIVACGFLTPIYDTLECHDVRLRVDGLDVLVDVPCSGAELLSLVGFICALISTFTRPGVIKGFFAVLIGLGLGLLGNGLRISLLALGLVHRAELPFNVMDTLPHTLIGLFMVVVCTLGLIAAHRLAPPVSAQMLSAQSPNPRLLKPTQLSFSSDYLMHSRWRQIFAFGFLPLALSISALQPQPVDVSSRLSPPEAPLVAAGFLRQPEAISDLESRYFNRYGGGSRRATYGPFGLLLVSTVSPLRHLHDPTICLSGMGYRVELLGTDHHTQTTLYTAQRDSADIPEARYLVRVSYRANNGLQAASVSEVVWHWLRQPSLQWTMVQRIEPMDQAISEGLAAEWESAIRRAFNLVDRTT